MTSRWLTSKGAVYNINSRTFVAVLHTHRQQVGGQGCCALPSNRPFTALSSGKHHSWLSAQSGHILQQSVQDQVEVTTNLPSITSNSTSTSSNLRFQRHSSLAGLWHATVQSFVLAAFGVLILPLLVLHQAAEQASHGLQVLQLATSQLGAALLNQSKDHIWQHYHPIKWLHMMLMLGLSVTPLFVVSVHQWQHQQTRTLICQYAATILLQTYSQLGLLLQTAPWKPQAKLVSIAGSLARAVSCCCALVRLVLIYKLIRSVPTLLDVVLCSIAGGIWALVLLGLLHNVQY